MQLPQMLRRLPLSGAHNTRDLGGYPCTGGATRWRTFLRSDNISAMPDSDASFLQNYGVQTVVDLRSGEECEANPSAIKGINGVTIHNVSLSDQMHATNFEGDLPGSMSGLYISLLDNSAASLAQAFTHLAEAPGGALFHCAVGKDRTGVVAMLLLSLAGVAQPDIVADYAMSEIYMAGVFTDAARRRDIPAHVLRSAPKSAQRTLQHISDTYGTAQNYLQTAGVSAAHINALKSKLVQPF